MKITSFSVYILVIVFALTTINCKNLKCEGKKCPDPRNTTAQAVKKERNTLTSHLVDHFAEGLVNPQKRKEIRHAVQYVPDSHRDSKTYMNPHLVKSGSLTNISNSATKLITPQYAGIIY